MNREEDSIQLARRLVHFAAEPQRTADERVLCEHLCDIYIRECREDLDLTRPALAKLLGVHPNTVAQWELRVSTPGLRHLMLLALVLEPTGAGLLHQLLAYRVPRERLGPGLIK